MNRGWLVKIALLAVALLLVAAACAKEATPAPAPGAPTPAAEKKPIRLYEIPDITGPVSIVALPLFEGALGWTRWINEQGGINGHRVELVYEDSGYEVPRILAIYTKWKAKGAFVTVQYSSGGGEATKPRGEKDRVVIYNFGQSDPQYYPPAYNLSWGMTYGDGMGVFLDWVKANWTKDRAPKIAILTYDNAFGRAPMEPGERYAKHLGMEWYGTEFASWVPADTTPQLVKFRDAGVDYFFSQFLTHTAAIVQRDMGKLGLHGKLTPVYFWWAPLDQMIEGAGADAEFAVNVQLHYNSSDVQVPGIAAMKAFAEGTGKKFNTAYIRGWRGHEFLAEGIKIALGQVGDDPDKITGEILLNALLSIKDFDSGLGPKEGIPGPNYRVLQDVGRIEQVQGGKVVVLTDWMKAPHLFPTDQAHLFPGEPVIGK